MLFEPKIVYPPAISNQPNIQEKKVWVCELPQVTTKHEKIIVAQQVPFPISHQINHGGDRNMIRYEMIRNEMRMQRPKEVQAKLYHNWAWKKLLKLRESFALIGNLAEEFKVRKVCELLKHKRARVS
ncbi:hypothetical protein V6N11_009089 [Hibiscus sabdariffa]|uniref:Uncharacterized protein n=1 Tax=Hibiscus sabdariffa TaxID=183260 RepID=A0ABR2PPM2_9ROSI